jgi:hypothetical protein
MKITEISGLDNSVIEREPTPDELKQMELDSIDNQKAKNKETEKATAKAALLNRLGISAEEAALLLG